MCLFSCACACVCVLLKDAPNWDAATSAQNTPRNQSTRFALRRVHGRIVGGVFPRCILAHADFGAKGTAGGKTSASTAVVRDGGGLDRCCDNDDDDIYAHDGDDDADVVSTDVKCVYRVAPDYGSDFEYIVFDA